MTNKRYDCIRDTVLNNDTNLEIQYSLIEDLRSLGGNRTRLCTFSRTWKGSDNPDTNGIADLFEEMVNKAKDNVRKLSEEYGFTCIFEVE